jgi:ABC-type antimicrobial peptide transport system permease subunit
VTADDSLTYAAVAVMLTAVAVASALPALRAARVDAMAALRG